MRPVEKKRPGELIGYTDSNMQKVEHRIKGHYPDYGDAKFPLSANIGAFCSYCEGCEKIPALDVEHLAAKSKGGDETAWDNFLLCCKVCNSCKGTKAAVADCHWPHLNNTYYSLVYDETGRVHVNGNMPERSRRKAQNLLDLIQLQRCPGTGKSPSPKDFRWRYRFEAWNKASRYKELYLKGAITEDDVIDYALCNGQWSIWFTVFKGIDAIRHRLITDFPGTCAHCFDEHNHYEPIERNPGCPDPV